VIQPLEYKRTAIYGADLDEKRFFESTRMLLAVASEARAADLISRGPSLIKVGSNETVDGLVRQALPGVPLIHMPSPPSTVPVKMNYQYFALDMVGEAWESIVRGRSLSVFVPSEFPEPKMELVILLPNRG
jgi:type VI secretion system protein ImpJ